MSHWITLVTPHGRINAWSSEPDDKPNGGVVLVPDVFGVNRDVRSIAERYSSRGYLTVSPALFDPLERDVELGYGLESFHKGSELAARTGLQVGTELVIAAAEAIAHAGNLALIGYGWGGTLALRAGRQLRAPAISYYGQPDEALQASDSPASAVLHFGTLDPLSLAVADGDTGIGGPLLRRYAYPAGAAFDRETDPGSYDAASSKLALERNLQILQDEVYTDHGNL